VPAGKNNLEQQHKNPSTACSASRQLAVHNNGNQGWRENEEIAATTSIKIDSTTEEEQLPPPTGY
jgi:hypothetical protein